MPLLSGHSLLSQEDHIKRIHNGQHLREPVCEMVHVTKKSTPSLIFHITLFLAAKMMSWLLSTSGKNNSRDRYRHLNYN